jgi:hypothetical protein
VNLKAKQIKIQHSLKKKTIQPETEFSKQTSNYYNQGLPEGV